MKVRVDVLGDLRGMKVLKKHIEHIERRKVWTTLEVMKMQ